MPLLVNQLVPLLPRAWDRDVVGWEGRGTPSLQSVSSFRTDRFRQSLGVRN